MATDYATLTTAARTEARDLPQSNPVMREGLNGPRDGVNTVFYLANRNIVSGIVSSVQYGPWATYGTTIRSLSTGAFPFTLDALNGIVTFTTAPDGGSSGALTQPLQMDYYFQWFLDADYSTWIDQATEELGQVAGSFVGPVSGGGDLTPALIQYVAERFWTNRASQYANKYATATSGASENIQTVTANFLSLAKVARAKAEKMRVAAYQDPGGKVSPYAATITYGMPNYTPRR